MGKRMPVLVFLFFLMILSLCACGTEEEIVAARYHSEAIPLPNGIESTATLKMRGDTLYIYDEMHSDDEWEYILAENVDGTVRHSFAINVPEGDLVAFYPEEDGLWIAALIYDESGHSETRLQYYRETADKMLEPEKDFAVPSVCEGPIELLVDGKELYLILGAPDACDGVICLSADGELRFTLSGQMGMSKLCLTENGQAAVCWMQENESRLVYLNTEKGTWMDGVSLSVPLTTLFDGGRWGTDGESLYAIESETGECTLLTEWIDLGIDNTVFSVWGIGEDEWLVSSKNGVFRIVASEAKLEATILTLATFNCEDTAAAALEFNSAQDEYYIEIKDYSVYNTKSDPAKGLERLGLDIASGNAPDLYDLRDIPVSKFIQKNYLEDLYPFIDADRELLRSDFFPSLLAAMETEGALYGIIPHCAVVTTLTAPETAEGLDSWDEAALCSLADGSDPFAGELTRSEFLTRMLVANNSFINWTEKKTFFDSEQFISLLSLAALLPDETPENWERDPLLVCDTLAYGSDFLIASFLLGCLDDEGAHAVSLGLPGSDSGNVLLVPAPYFWGISSDSVHKTGAWEFIRSFLCFERQVKTFSIPMRRDAWEAQRADSEAAIATSNAVLFSMTRKGDLSMTVGDTRGLDALEELISNVVSVYEYDPALMEIICSEAQGFFAGDKSAEETAKNVQSRVSIYIAEHG